VITDWAALPLVMHPEHLAHLLGVSVSTVWTRCRQRTMRPAPISWEKPWEWSRERVRAAYESGMPLPVGRPGRQTKARRQHMVGVQ